MTSPLRVGSVPYLVGRPLDLGLGEEPGIELSHDVPAVLVERLREGEIDVAVLPPAIGGEDDKPAPRRRRRKEGEDEDVSAVG